MGILKDKEPTPVLQEDVTVQQVPTSVAKARAGGIVVSGDADPSVLPKLEANIKKSGTLNLDSIYLDKLATRVQNEARKEQLSALQAGESQAVLDADTRAASIISSAMNSLSHAAFYNEVVNKLPKESIDVEQEFSKATRLGQETENAIQANNLAMFEELERERYYGETIAEFGASAIPLVTNLQSADVADALASNLGITLESTLPSNRMDELRSWYLSSETPEEANGKANAVISAIKAVQSDSTLPFDELSVLSYITEGDSWWLNVDLVADALTLGAGKVAVGTFKGAKKSAQGAKNTQQLLADTVKSNSPDVFQNELVNAVNELKTTGTINKNTLFSDPIDATDEVLPSAFKTERLNALNYLPGRATERLSDRTKEFQEALKSEYMLSPFDDLTKMTAVKASTLQVAKSLKAKAADFVITHDDIGNPFKVTAFLGKNGTDGAFVSEKAARAAANDLLGEGVPYDVIRPYGEKRGFMLAVSKDVKPGEYLGALHLKKQDSGALDRLVGAASNLVDTTYFTRSLAWKSQFQKDVINPLKKPLNDLKPYERGIISQALDKSSVEQAWMNKTEFANYLKSTGTKYDPKLYTAYKSARDLEDLNWLVLNSGVYGKLNSLGFKTIDFTNTPIDEGLKTHFATAKVGDVTSVTDAQVFDMSARKIVDTKNLDLAKLKDKGYIKVELYDATEVMGQRIRTAIVPEKSIKVGDLHPKQLGYRVGMARTYTPDGKTARYKIGQYVKGYRPVTTTLVNDAAKGTKFISQLEEARGLYNKWVSGVPESTLIRSFDEIGLQGKLADWNTVKAEFASGRLNASVPFEIAPIKEDLPSAAIDKLAKTNTGKFERDPELDALYDTGALYWSPRGEHLMDVDGNKLATLDPLEALDKSTRAMMNTQAYMAYGQRAMVQYVNRFVKDKTLDVRTAFSIDPMRLGLTPKEERLARSAQQTIKRLANTKEERHWQATLERASYFLDKEGLNKIAPVVWDVAQKDPVGALRSLAFHTFLGLGNIAQFALQSTQSLMIAAVTKDVPFSVVLKDAWTLRAIALNPNDSTKVAIMKHMTKNFGDDIDAEHFISTVARSGFMNIANDHALADLSNMGGLLLRTDQGGRKSIWQAAQNVGGVVAEKGRYFFDQAEGLNRGSAMSIAYRKLVKEKGRAYLNTDNGIAELVDLADGYNFRMLSSRQSAFQQGALSLPTQFLSYSFRFMEAVLPQKLGGSTVLSKMEKARLVAFAGLISGTEGLPAATGTYDALRELAGVQDDPNYTVDKFIRNGFIDGLVYALSDGEANTSFGRRAAPVRAIADTLTKIFDEDTSFVEVAGGAAGTVGVNLFDTLSVMARLSSAEIEDGSVYWQSLGRALADNVSSISNAHKAIIALETGKLISRSGNTVADITNLEAILLPLGITPSAYFMVQDNYVAEKDRKAAVKEAAKVVGKIMKDAARSVDIDDLTVYNNKIREAEAMLATYPEDMQADIRKQASYGQSQSFMAETLVNKHFEQEAMNPQEQLLFKRMQENQ